MCFRLTCSVTIVKGFGKSTSGRKYLLRLYHTSETWEVSIRNVAVILYWWCAAMTDSGVRKLWRKWIRGREWRKDGHSPMQRDACACASTSVAPNHLRAQG
jgi:hypothetical protein